MNKPSEDLNDINKFINFDQSDIPLVQSIGNDTVQQYKGIIIIKKALQ